MPFARPTLTDLRTQAATDLNARLSGIDALLRYSNLGIVADVLAGLVNGLYGYLDWIALQSNPFTATGEYLEGWAGLKKVTRKPASNATGPSGFPGTNGVVIPAGTAVNRSDGFAYVTSADATVASGSAALALYAAVPGAAGNAASGSVLYLGVGIAGVSGTGAASGPITGGAAIETDAALRSRMLAVYANPPEGGDIDDYGEWALEVPGVTRAWIVPSAMGPGTVVLQFMMDIANAAYGGFPQGTNGCAAAEVRDTAAAGDQLALANALFGNQQVTTLLYAVAPGSNVVNFTINGIAGASADTQAAIAAAIDAALLVGAKPGGVTPILPIEAAIAGVSGTTGAVLTAITCTRGSVAPGLAGNITSTSGYLPTRGTVTYT